MVHELGAASMPSASPPPPTTVQPSLVPLPAPFTPLRPLNGIAPIQQSPPAYPVASSPIPLSLSVSLSDTSLLNDSLTLHEYEDSFTDPAAITAGDGHTDNDNDNGNDNDNDSENRSNGNRQSSPVKHSGGGLIDNEADISLRIDDSANESKLSHTDSDHDRDHDHDSYEGDYNGSDNDEDPNVSQIQHTADLNDSNHTDTRYNRSDMAQQLAHEVFETKMQLQSIQVYHRKEISQLTERHAHAINTLNQDHQRALVTRENDWRLQAVEERERIKTLEAEIDAQKLLLANINVNNHSANNHSNETATNVSGELIDSLKDELRHRDSLLNDSETLIEQLKQENAVQYEELLKCQSKLSAMQQSQSDRELAETELTKVEISAMMIELNSFQDNTNVLTQQLKDQSATIDCHQQRIAELTSDLTELQSNHSVLTAKNDELTAANNVHLQTIQTIQKVNASTATSDSANSSKLRHEIDRLEMVTRGLERENHSLKQKLQSRITDHHALVNAFNDRVDRTEYSELVQKLRDHEQWKKEWLSEREKLVTEAESNRTLVTELRENYSHLLSERSDLRINYELLSNELRSLTEAYDDSKSQHESTIATLHSDLSQAKCEAAKHRMQNENLMAELTIISERLATVESQLSEKNDIINGMSSEGEGQPNVTYQQLQTDSNASSIVNSVATNVVASDNDTGSDDPSSDDGDHLSRRARYQKAKQTIKQAYDTLIYAENQISLLLADKNRLKLTVSESESEIASLQSEIANHLTEQTKLKTKVKSLKDERAQLRSELAKHSVSKSRTAIDNYNQHHHHDEKENQLHNRASHALKPFPPPINLRLLLRPLLTELRELRQSYLRLKSEVPTIIASVASAVITEVNSTSKVLLLTLDDANNDRDSLNAALTALKSRMSWRYSSLLQAHERHHRSYASLLAQQEEVLRGTNDDDDDDDEDRRVVRSTKHHRQSNSVGEELHARPHVSNGDAGVVAPDRRSRSHPRDLTAPPQRR